MKRFFLLFLILAGLITSCGEYHRITKSGDYDLIYNKAIEYYNKGAYAKARELFDGIDKVYTGHARAQTIAYYRAFCRFYEKSYTDGPNGGAVTLFEQFVKNYPESSYAEECLYMVGYSYYLSSPNERLDQTHTEKAVEYFQLFLSYYPNSSRKEQINEYIDVLWNKLSYKDYLSAENYYKREEYVAAVVSLENCLRDFPGTKYREDIMYMIFNSKYEMALHSVESKKYDRYTEAKEEYYYFVDEYPNSRRSQELLRKYEELNRFLDQYDEGDDVED